MANFTFGLRARSDDPAQIKIRLAGLVVACPFAQDNPPACPMHAVRQRPLHERYRWLGALLPIQMKNLQAQHDDCIQRKEKAGHGPA